MAQAPDSTMARLVDTLARTSRKAQLTAANIANIDTPGYRAKRVAFEDAMGAALPMAQTRGDHMQLGGMSAGGVVYDSPSARMRGDGNNVDIDVEMADLARESGKFATTTSLIKKRFALLHYAVTDGGR